MKNTMKTIVALMLFALGLNTAVAADSALLIEAKQLIADNGTLNKIPAGEVKTAASAAYNQRITAVMLQWETLFAEDTVAARKVFDIYHWFRVRVKADHPRYIAPNAQIDLSALAKQHWQGRYVSDFATAAEVKQATLAKYKRGSWYVESEEALTTAGEGAFRNAAQRLNDATIIDYVYRQYLGEGRTDNDYVNWFNAYIRPLPITEAIAMLKTEIRGVNAKPEGKQRNKVLQNYITSLAVLEKL